MLLCHGRVGTASLLEALQKIDEVFVPSYWHTDPFMQEGSLKQLSRNDSRLSEQSTLPLALDDVAAEDGPSAASTRPSTSAQLVTSQLRPIARSAPPSSRGPKLDHPGLDPRC